MKSTKDLKNCVRCGIGFTPQGDWYNRKGQITCTQQCRSLYERSRIDLLVGKGIPLITVFADRVVCNICQMSMTCPGSHMLRTHLLPVGKNLTKSERQIIYGLPQGARMVPSTYLDDSRERAVSHGFALTGARFSSTNQPFEDCPPHIVRAPRSDLQVEAFASIIGTELHGGVAKHRRAATTKVCLGCGTEFTLPQSKMALRKYCSRECSAKCIQSGGNRTPRPHAGIAISATMRARPDAIKPKLCPQCGEAFQPNFRAKVFCGSECYKASGLRLRPRGTPITPEAIEALRKARGFVAVG
jgi:hypothetical protein